MKDLRQTSQYANYLRGIGWEVDSVDGVNIFVKKVPLIGSVIKIQRPEEKVNSDELLVISKKKRSFAVYIEPKTEKQKNYYLRNGFRKTKSPSLPSKTIQFDITKSKKKLLSEMHYKTRYNIGLSKRRGVQVKISDDVNKFADFWQESAKKRGMFFSQKKEIKEVYKAFGKKAVILNAIHLNEVTASVMILSTGTISYYMYSASTPIGNKVFAPTILVWKVLLWSKKKKIKIFDFEGIYDERFPLKRWKGFSRFKKSFGGKEIESPPPLRRYYLPF
jgi:lipid II:glycine glycyltransferase (peptidoglycan interpeptide bridge formation enzyme)